jgi:uncharacterized protein YdhG (YjbR/CyaY superfamily)
VASCKTSPVPQGPVVLGFSTYKRHCGSFPPRVVDCITSDLDVLPSDCFQYIFGFRPTVVVNQESYKFIVYKIILICMTMIIMMITGKRKVVPATKIVHISSGTRIIPAFRKKGHIRFCPRSAGIMSFLVNGYCRFTEEWIIPELRCVHNW